MRRLKDIPSAKLEQAIELARKYSYAVLSSEGRKEIGSVTEAEGSMAYNHGVLAATLQLALSPKEMEMFTEVLNKVNQLCKAEIEKAKTQSIESGVAECAD